MVMVNQVINKHGHILVNRYKINIKIDYKIK